MQTVRMHLSTELCLDVTETVFCTTKLASFALVAASIFFVVRHSLLRYNEWKNSSSTDFLEDCKAPSKENIPSKELLDSIALRNWKTILSWIAFHPDQVTKLRDTRGQTVLHQATLFRAPDHVFSMILWVAPELASVRNQDGEVPLHWAIRLSTPNTVLALLLRANPETAFWNDNQYVSPLSLLWDRNQLSLSNKWRLGRENLLADPSWKRILSMFLAVHQAHNPDFSENFLPLHIAACRRSPTSCLFPLMVEVYKEHLWISDADGNFPLSIACQCPVANRSSYLLTKVQLLLRENPRAATLCNSRGRYPLHVALNSGIAWNEGIAALLQAFPPALNIRDPLTRLYPFALAAMAPDDLPTKNDLTTVFCVLRADPSILKPNF